MTRTLITASLVFAGDPPQPKANALIVEGSRIEWVGSVDDVPRPVPRQRDDLGDAVVIPGLIDSHQHLLDSQLTRRWADCRTARSPEEAVERLKEHAPLVAEGAWIVGWGYDAAEVEGGRRATRAMLDEVSSERPVLLMESSFHQAAANSAAFAAVGFGRATPKRWGGEVERDRHGEPTGMAWERAFSVLAWKARDAELEALGAGRSTEEARATCMAALAQGITHVGEAFAAPDDIERYAGAGLPVGMTLMPASGAGAFATPWDALDGPRTGEGDARFGVGHLKLFADGAERCAISVPLGKAARQTAAIVAEAARTRNPTGLRVLTTSRARYSRGRLRSGTLHYPPGAMADIVAAALRSGFRIAVHALGNDGVGAALAAFDEGRSRTGVDVAGCRIEHAMFVEPRQLEEAAALGLILSMQPGHAVHYVKTLRVSKIDRVMGPVPMRTAIDAGCRVAISSDGPTAPGTALENMRAAVDRMAIDGRPIRPDLGINRTEALRAATVGGAEACGVEATKGALVAGKQADLAVVSGDPFDPRTVVLETWVEGIRAYRREG